MGDVPQCGFTQIPTEACLRCSRALRRAAGAAAPTSRLGGRDPRRPGRSRRPRSAVRAPGGGTGTRVAATILACDAAGSACRPSTGSAGRRALRPRPPDLRRPRSRAPARGPGRLAAARPAVACRVAGRRRRPRDRRGRRLLVARPRAGPTDAAVSPPPRSPPSGGARSLGTLAGRDLEVASRTLRAARVLKQIVPRDGPGGRDPRRRRPPDRSRPGRRRRRIPRRARTGRSGSAQVSSALAASPGGAPPSRSTSSRSRPGCPSASALWRVARGTEPPDAWTSATSCSSPSRTTTSCRPGSTGAASSPTRSSRRSTRTTAASTRSRRSSIPSPGSSLRGFRNLVWDLSGAADFLSLEVARDRCPARRATPDRLTLKPGT